MQMNRNCKYVKKKWNKMNVRQSENEYNKDEL